MTRTQSKIDPVEQSWDKKKLIIAFVFLVLITIAGYWGKKMLLSSGYSKSVAGVNTVENQQESESEKRVTIPDISFSKETIKTTAQEKLNSIKQQVQSLNVQDIASSSPQVQKVINDLKSLENYPRDQAKQMCENICKGL